MVDWLLLLLRIGGLILVIDGSCSITYYLARGETFRKQRLAMWTRFARFLLGLLMVMGS